MLRWRLLAAAVILTPLITLLFLDASWNAGVPGLWLMPLGWLLTLLATAEMLDLLRSRGRELPPAWSVFAAASLLFVGAGCSPVWLSLLDPSYRETFVALPPLSWSAVMVSAIVGLAFLVEMIRYQEPGASTERVALGLLVTIYPGLFIALLAQLRFVQGNAWGMAALVSVVFVVKISDTAAYAVGKLAGRHKMAPRLSPGKTVEGGVGALLGASAASWVYFLWLVPVLVPGGQTHQAAVRSVLYGLIVGLAGMLGDLAESLVKRDCRQKDSSRWLPGLGGVLDILDSLLFAAPAALFCWLTGLVGPP